MGKHKPLSWGPGWNTVDVKNNSYNRCLGMSQVRLVTCLYHHFLNKTITQLLMVVLHLYNRTSGQPGLD